MSNRAKSALRKALKGLRSPRELLGLAGFALRQRTHALQGALAAATEAKPATAPAAIGTLDAAIDLLASRTDVIVLERWPGYARIALFDLDLMPEIAALEANIAGASIRLRQASQSTPVASAAKGVAQALALSAAQSVVIGWTGPDGGECLEIEGYRKLGDEEWLSPNPDNHLLRRRYEPLSRRPRLRNLADVLGAEPLSHVTDPIDVVYTWVNHEDPDWQALYRTAKAGQHGAATGSSDAASLARFHSSDELRYSLRSLHRNARWYRQIYVLTNCRPPAWLNSACPDIRWIDHTEIIPEAYLPTFNSHVIESFLHRLPGLSDRFLYMNDDVFLGRPLSKQDFFLSNGMTKSFLEPYGVVSGPPKAGDPDYLNAARNSARLLREATGRHPTVLHKHTPFALDKTVLAEIEQRFPDPIAQTRANRFRTGQDLNIVSFLVHHYAYANRRAIPATIRDRLVRSESLLWKDELAALDAAAPDVFCLNEGGGAGAPADWEAEVKALLERMFPARPPWEA